MLDHQRTDHDAGVRRPVLRFVGGEPPGGSPLPRHGHSVQFYADDARLERSVAHFAAAALAAGDAVVIVATPAHRAGVARLLADLPARQASRVAYLDAATMLEQCRSDDGALDRARFEAALGGEVARALTGAPRVAIYGELVALLSAAGKHDQALQLERYWHDLLARYRASLLCGYPMRDFASASGAGAFDLVCDAHDHVFPVDDAAHDDEEARRRATARLQHRLETLEAEAVERERRSAAQNEELLAALEVRDGFLMAAAHELKTPLTSLRVYAQLLRRDVANQKEITLDRLATALQAIERQTGQINHLVDRLLDIGQIEAGILRIETAPADLVAVVREALGQHERGATHEIVLDAPASLPATLDPIRFEQVVTILLGNAVKFSPAGSRVTVAIAAGDDGSVELSVSDEGLGVAPEQRESIFERYHPGHEQRHLAGLGLSLPIARRIVELHGGTIRVEPVEPHGARFVVTLPGNDTGSHIR